MKLSQHRLREQIGNLAAVAKSSIICNKKMKL